MKKLLVAISLAIALFPSLALADPVQVDMVVTSPAKNSTVGSQFTIKGTLSQSCPLSNDVYVDDNVDSGSYNYAKPYDAKASHSYSLTAPHSVSGNTFTYTVDLAKAYWNVGGNGSPNLIPQVPQPGKARIYIATDYMDQSCYGSVDPLEVTISYPVVVQPVKAPVPKPVPSAIAAKISSPSPSPSVAPVMATPEVKADNSDNLPSWVVLLLSALAGAGLLSLAEVSALSYLRKHPHKK